MTKHAIAAIFAAVLSLLAANASAAGISIRHLECYVLKPAGPFARVPDVKLVDRFGPRTVTITRVAKLCAPADKRGEDPGAELDPLHLTAYRLKEEDRFLPKVRNLRVVNQFGEAFVDVLQVQRLLVPTHKGLTTPPQPPTSPEGHFACYRVRRSRGTTPFPQIDDLEITTQFETVRVNVRNMRWLCVPVDKNDEDPGAPSRAEHLACYRTRSRGRLPRSEVFIANQFGAQRNRLSGPRRELCVPSLVGTGVSTTTMAPTTTTMAPTTTTMAPTTTTMAPTTTTTTTSTSSSTTSTTRPDDCGLATAPECLGACPPGSSCVATLPGFRNALPECFCKPDPCGGQPTLPECLGDCPTDSICVPATSTQRGPLADCICVPTMDVLCGGSPTFPECLGDCPAGLRCGPDTQVATGDPRALGQCVCRLEQN